jgi:hypothetical protein
MSTLGRIHMGPKSQVPLMLASFNMEVKSQLLNLNKSLKYGWLLLLQSNPMNGENRQLVTEEPVEFEI